MKKLLCSLFKVPNAKHREMTVTQKNNLGISSKEITLETSLV